MIIAIWVLSIMVAALIIFILVFFNWIIRSQYRGLAAYLKHELQFDEEKIPGEIAVIDRYITKVKNGEKLT